MARFCHFTTPDGSPLKVRLSAIAAWAPDIIASCPNVKSRIILSLGSAHTYYVQEDYDYICAAMKDSND